MNLHRPNSNVLPFPIYSLEIASFSELERTTFPSKNFVILTAANFSGTDSSEITSIAIGLITKGLKYVLCWGKECEKAHDAFDLGNILWEEKEKTQNHVMSTWHNDESFEDVLWFCLHHASPDDKYWESTSIVVVSVNKAISKSQLEYLSDTQALNAAVGL